MFCAIHTFSKYVELLQGFPGVIPIHVELYSGAQIGKNMQALWAMEWKCVAGSCQSIKAAASQNKNSTMGGPSTVVCRFHWQSRSANISHSSIRMGKGYRSGIYDGGVSVKVGFKGLRYRESYSICVASARSPGSARDEVKHEFVRDETYKCVNGDATKPANTEELPGVVC